MATTQEMLDDAELAKSYITNSQLTDEYKRIYLRLIKISTIATNGISPEEKIQMMTEAIQLLAVTQGMFMANIDKRIDDAVQNANKKQCVDCRAMKYVTKVEEEQKNDHIIREWREKHGISDPTKTSTEDVDNMSWSSVLKTVVLKPYSWVVAGILVISPFGVQIVQQLLNFFAK